MSEKIPANWLEQSAMVIVAHPDDEVIGLGALLTNLKGLQAVLHITDGAPRGADYSINAGAKTWEEYAQLRRNELHAALKEAGLSFVLQLSFDNPDQEASLQISSNARRLSTLFAELQPRFVFTHPYEGGHPDHDATAMAVHCAVDLLRLGGKPPPIIVEHTSYHAGANGMETSSFLPNRSVKVIGRSLTAQESAAKQNLFACYVSQREVLQYFPIGEEPLRLAPRYDFTQPPHEGKLYYENFNWGVTGTQWRELAAEALRNLGL